MVRMSNVTQETGNFSEWVRVCVCAFVCLILCCARSLIVYKSAQKGTQRHIHTYSCTLCFGFPNCNNIFALFILILKVKLNKKPILFILLFLQIFPHAFVAHAWKYLNLDDNTSQINYIGSMAYIEIHRTSCVPCVSQRYKWP